MFRQILKKGDITRFLIELMVVFLGVTAAFILNNWAETKREHEVERKYLGSMYDDILKNEEDLNNLLQYYKEKASMMKELIQLQKNRGSIRRIETLISETLFTMRFFLVENDTWKSLRESGELKLLRNLKLKLLMSDLDRRYNALRNHSEILRNFTETRLLDFGLENMELQENIDFFNKDSAYSRYFLNLTTTAYLIALDHIRSLEQTIDSLKEIKSALAGELKIESK